MKITEDKNEIIELGRQIVSDNPELYPQEIIDEWWKIVSRYYKCKQDFINTIYSGAYCNEVYGTTTEEYVMFDFANKSHEEKMEYLTAQNAIEYTRFANNEHDTHLLENKYNTYQLLKPFYKREALLLSDQNDYDNFIAFINKHKCVYVKPVNLSRAIGVHKITIDEYSDLQVIFSLLLQEAKEIVSNKPEKKAINKLILEEEIIPSHEIAQFNPNEMSVLRVSTVLVDGEVKFLYPCFRMMCGDGESLSGEKYSLEALIDAASGVVVTDGMNAYEKAEVHPVTGVKIKGFIMPEWDKLKSMLNTAAHLFPNVRYIGWDVVHSAKGWCIIEGNPCGEFFSQMCLGHGIKNEFCKLINYPIDDRI